MLISKLDEIRVFSNWDNSADQYEELFDEVIEHQRAITIADKQTETIVKYKK